MMLRLAVGISLPVELVIKSVGILAVKRAGKSHIERVARDQAFTLKLGHAAEASAEGDQNRAWRCGGRVGRPHPQLVLVTSRHPLQRGPSQVRAWVR